MATANMPNPPLCAAWMPTSPFLACPAPILPAPSWIPTPAVNIILLVAKVWAWVLSGSKAVMASAADSTVDLISQVVIR